MLEKRITFEFAQGSPEARGDGIVQHALKSVCSSL
jgi:hypothetical protein